MLPVLALDTATETIAAGLHAGAADFTLSAPGGALASTHLLPLLHTLLDRAGLQWRDLRALAYGQGPGAFTGLRTACAVAQGLGYGIGCRLLPLDSLLIVAEDARVQADAAADGFDVAVAMDARMDEAYAARYRWRADRQADRQADWQGDWQGGHWQVLQAPALYTLPALILAWSVSSAPAVLAGSALAAFGPRLLLPPGWQRVEEEHDRPAALLRLARRAAQSGAGVDPADALPLYLRDKVALTTAERAAVKALATAPPTPA